MKKLFSVLLTTLVIFSCNEKRESASIRNDLFFDNLKGEVKKVEETPYTMDSIGKTSAIDSCCIIITEYDNKGYRTSQDNKDFNGNEKNRQTYISRHKNGLVKEIKFTENGKLTSTLSGTLNKEGNYSDTKSFDSSGQLEFFYSNVLVNKYGKIISMKKFTPDSTFQQTIVNKYNKQIWIGGFITDSSGKEIFSATVTLNEIMNPVEVTQTIMVNSLPNITTTWYAYTLYDEHGNWTKCNKIDEKGSVRKILKRKITYRK